MPSAYILINVESGSEENVLKQIKGQNFVEEAYISYGVYDLIVKVKADSMDELKRTVSLKMRNINQVRSTLTLILVES